MATPATGGSYGVERRFANMDLHCKSLIASGANVLSQPEFLTGNVFYVNSSVSVAGDGTSPQFATDSLDTAIGLCTANNGDKIIVMPNHSETITGAGGIAADVAGITILGLGRGKQRPRFLMDGADTVSVTVTAADVTIANLEFAAGHADVATCFDVDAAGFHLLGCKFFDNVATENFLAIVTSGSATDNVCDGMVICHNYWYSPDASATFFIDHTGDVDELIIEHNNVLLPAGTGSELLNVAAGDDMQGVSIKWNFLQHVMTSGELFISNNQSDNSGIIAHNRIRHADVTGAHDLGIDALGCGLFDNLSTSTASVSGFVLPAIDVDL